MNPDGSDSLSIDEFVEYCRTQAGLLSGSVERMGTEVADLLDELDEETAAIRSLLEDRSDDPPGPATPVAGVSPDSTAVDVETIEELEAAIETKQTLVEAKQARMRAHQELAAAYTELAESLQSEAEDGREAMDRVVRFEGDHDAPAYFPDRQTVYEAATSDRQTDPS